MALGTSTGASGGPSTGASQSDRGEAAQRPMAGRFAGLRFCRHLCGYRGVARRSPVRPSVRPPVRSPVRPPFDAGPGSESRTPSPFAGFGLCRHIYAHLRSSHFDLTRALCSRPNRYRLRAGYATLLPDTARTCVERQLALSTFAARASVVVESRISRSTLAVRCSVGVGGTHGRKQTR